MLAGNKVIITVAINGGMQQDRDGAIVPKQPAEIGEAAARCHAAGAAMIHVHARDAQGKNSGDREIYGEIIRQIRARSPILIQTTNGIGVRRGCRDRPVHLAHRQGAPRAFSTWILRRICSASPAARRISTTQRVVIRKKCHT
jgi:uncharacterized protein (DUF849 family)